MGNQVYVRSIEPSLHILIFLLLCLHCLASPVHPREDGNEVSFGIRGYEVTGNSVLTEKEIYRTLEGHTGPHMTAEDVEGARDALEDLYHRSGYPTVLVNIPQQRVEDGLVRLEVIESRIRRVRVTENRYFTMEKILDALPSLRQGEILFVPRVREELARLNRNPDFKASPILSPAREIGLVDVELNVKDEFPLHASMEVNNRNTHDTSELRLNGMIRYDNLWQKEHSVSFQYQTAPLDLDEVHVMAASYVFPTPWNPNHLLAFFGVVSESQTAFGEGFQVNGEGNLFGARYVIPLPPNGDYNHNLTIGLDYKDFDETLGFETEGQETLKTPLTYLPLSLSYSASHADKTGFTRFSGGIHLAFRGLVTDPEEFAIKRYQARANYLYATLGAERTQRLPGGFGLFGKIDGQIADGPLVSNEQYAAGGMESVRGYKESEAFGDHAFHAVLELSGPDLTRLINPGDGFALTPYVFGDYAYLKITEPLPDQAEKIHLLGTGIGLKGRIAERWTFQMEGAMALEETDQVEHGDIEVHGRLKYAF
ncbi:MAG: ShlB/FhaC/HecB family hemolysin secretion/activation protein [Desulfobacteraceae bacterium]|jgi:hemolysin activation/secretion protein